MDRWEYFSDTLFARSERTMSDEFRVHHSEFIVGCWPNSYQGIDITAAIVSMPSQRFCKRRFSFSACWLLS